MLDFVFHSERNWVYSRLCCPGPARWNKQKKKNTWAVVRLFPYTKSQYSIMHQRPGSCSLHPFSGCDLWPWLLPACKVGNHGSLFCPTQFAQLRKDGYGSIHVCMVLAIVSISPDNIYQSNCWMLLASSVFFVAVRLDEPDNLNKLWAMACFNW